LEYHLTADDPPVDAYPASPCIAINSQLGVRVKLPEGGIRPGQALCRTTRKDGEPCRAFATLSGYCASHDPDRHDEMQAARSLGGTNRAKPGGMEILRELVEERLADVVRPLFEGLIAERVVGFEDGAPIEVPDHAIRLKASESLLDRAYGRPTTRAEVSGADGGPITLAALLATDTRDLV
jgi:hypothetical protein